MARKKVMRVELNGQNEFTRFLNSLSASMSQALTEGATMAGAEIVRDEARNGAPYDTGALQASIQADVDKEAAPGMAETLVGPTIFYGLFVEYGTQHNAAHPYLRPAADAAEQRAQRAMARIIIKAMERAG
jgi:HK97 gp10 family phage protein